jgi:hypothetical protein
MPTLDSTVGGLSSNSYLSQSEALDLLEVVLSAAQSEAFFRQSSDERDAALIKASRTLDRSFDWSGYREDNDQAMAWPRYGVYVDGDQVDDDIIPKELKDATLLLAAQISQGLTVENSLSTPVTSVKLGPIDVKFDAAKTKSKATLSEEVVSMLSKLGSFIGQSGYARAITLER